MQNAGRLLPYSGCDCLSGERGSLGEAVVQQQENLPRDPPSMTARATAHPGQLIPLTSHPVSSGGLTGTRSMGWGCVSGRQEQWPRGRGCPLESLDTQHRVPGPNPGRRGAGL